MGIWDAPKECLGFLIGLNERDDVYAWLILGLWWRRMFRLVKEQYVCVCRRAAQSTEIASGKYSLWAATRSAHELLKRPQEFTSVCYSWLLYGFTRKLSPYKLHPLNSKSTPKVNDTQSLIKQILSSVLYSNLYPLYCIHLDKLWLY